MRKLITRTLIFGTLWLMTTAALADMTVKGFLEKTDGNTLNIVDKDNKTTKIHIIPTTIAVSRNSKNKIDPHTIHQGSVVNAAVRDGDIRVLIVMEEPK